MQTTETAIEHLLTQCTAKYTVEDVRSIDLIWPTVAPFIDQALAYTDGELTTENIYWFLAQGGMQLWVVRKDSRIVGVATTETVYYPRCTELRVVTLAGEGFTEWGDKINEALTDRARQIGAKAIQIVGRRGWERMAASLGVKPKYTVYKKEIGYG